MAKYTLLPTKKIWFILGLLSLICVENINSSNKGCPPIYEVLEYELNIEKSIINNICRTEYYVDESSADDSGASGETTPHFKSICSFDCDEYIEFCPLLSKKLHYTLIYDYSDLRWKYNEILAVCKKWDELYYTPEPDTTTTTAKEITTPTATDTTTPTEPITQQVNRQAKKYSKDGSIAIVSVMGIMLGGVICISIYLCRR
jgi:hypothetical protein